VAKYVLTKNRNPKIVANYLVHKKLQRNRLKQYFVATYIQLAKLPVIKQKCNSKGTCKTCGIERQRQRNQKPTTL